MTIKGKVIQVLDVQTGTSKNGEWRKQSFIIETEGQYPKKVCIGLWGDKVNNPDVVVGNLVEVSVNPESREYNGNWYTDLQAWRIEVVGGGQATTQAPSQPQLPQDDMPF